jgi:hypothetical protein
MEFAYDGGGLGKGGTATLYIDGDEAGEGRVEATVPMIFSGDETCDVGSDTASPVTYDYMPEESHFTGTGRMGTDRHRRGGGRPRSPHLPAGAPADRNGAAVSDLAKESGGHL